MMLYRRDGSGTSRLPTCVLIRRVE